MSLQKSDVEKIAHLARLSLNDADVPDYAENLSNILKLVDQMTAVESSIELGDVEPMAHPLDATQPLRADQVTETDQRQHFQKIAPRTENGLYLVPKVIE